MENNGRTPWLLMMFDLSLTEALCLCLTPSPRSKFDTYRLWNKPVVLDFSSILLKSVGAGNARDRSIAPPASPWLMPRRPPRPGALADLAPLRIFTQIVVLQVAYYASALVLIVFTALAAGKTMELGLILDWHNLRGDVTDGWMLALCWMFTSLITVIYLLLLIARSKLIPDFALTIHFINLITCSFYSHSIPRNIFWWGLQAASAALMTFLGIWACQWRELQPINFGGVATSGRNDVERADNDDGVGYPRGRGGRTRGGGGAYELMSMKAGV